MKKTLLACAIAFASITSAQAQNFNPVRYFVGFGLTDGGDTLATVQYTNGYGSNIKAGSGLQMAAGVDYRVNQQVSVQASLGYHVRFSPEANNGDASFTRIPVELLAYFHPDQQWRVGGGVRLVSSPKLNGSGAAANIATNFKDTTGLVLEAEYFVNPKVGIKVRAVSEKYEVAGGSSDISGNHIGVFGNFYF